MFWKTDDEFNSDHRTDRKNNTMKICINCGSSPGADEMYGRAARQLGRYLAEHRISLVYGGADVGLMGYVADAALEAGGNVTGVITETLAEKVRHESLTELIIVATMHERKMKMFELADGFMALPGGLGTLDELFEVMTWAQLGIHAKPVGLLNIGNYFGKLLDFLDYGVEQRFIPEAHRNMLLVDEDPAALIDKFASYKAPIIDNWIDRGGGIAYPEFTPRPL